MRKLAPLALYSYPDAQALVGLRVVTPVSWSSAPDPSCRAGAGTICHCEPFQWAARLTVGLGCAMLPTTHTSFGEEADTPAAVKKQSVRAVLHALCAENGTIVQLVPLKCSNSGSMVAPLVGTSVPTAHRSAGPDPPMAVSVPVSPGGRAGMPAMDQAVPFQCSITGC